MSILISRALLPSQLPISSTIVLLTRRSALCSAITFACFALAPHAGAQCRDGCDDSYNTFQGIGTLLSNTAYQNTALGSWALGNNASGHDNTATGLEAAFSNTSGSENTASGSAALANNTTGGQNTAVGRSALLGGIDASNRANGTGSFNTAVGFESLRSTTTGGGNVADGWQALFGNTSGIYNTATGTSALRQNSIGSNNTATGLNSLYHNNAQNNTAGGAYSLQNNATGGSNVALGYQAGLNLTTGSNNIVIGANVLGKAGDANKIMIGKQGTQTATYIAGISGKTVASASAVAVFIDNTGKLGTVKSSARYKDEIKPMNTSSEALLKLKPVTFCYKHELDPDGVRQFGLIAEQVEKVNPDLVVRDEDGKVSTVRYEAVNAMLLNEFLKEHRMVQEQQARIGELESRLEKQERTAEQQNQLKARVAQQQKQIETLTATVQKVCAHIQAAELAPRVVTNRP